MDLPVIKVWDGIEDAEYFLLLCLSYDALRRDLLTGISVVLKPFPLFHSLSNNNLTQPLLYGDKNLSDSVNKSILRPRLH